MEKSAIKTKEDFYAERVKNAFTIRNTSFYGKWEDQNDITEIVHNSKEENLDLYVGSKGGVWKNSEGYAKLWGEIESLQKKCKDNYKKQVNINNFPDDYYDLINRIRIDITRKRIEEMDFTPELTIEDTNPNYPRSIPLIEFLGFTGAFERIRGRNENVAMIEQRTGALGTVDVLLYALGHARTLEDELYNMSIFSLEKVNEAVSRAHTALRNHICFNPFINLSNTGGWNTGQQVAAVNAATYDESLYLTLRNAIRILKRLMDCQTRQQVTGSPVLVVADEVIQWDIDRIVRGQLAGFGATVRNRESLPISQIWVYQGDTITVGPKTYTYPGVPRGTAYLLIPGPAGAPTWTFNKRQLTQEVGRGGVLQLSREQRAWYFGQAEYREEFLGSSSTVINLPSDGNTYGWIVEIELPAEPDAT